MTMTHDTTTPRALAAVALAVLLLAATPLAVTASATEAPPTDSAPGTVERTASLADATPPNNTTTTVPTTTTTAPPGGNDTRRSGPPTMASQARITPTVPDEDYVDVTVVESDAVYNTTGGFATFSVSEPVTAARIPQDGASVDVFGDGHVIQIQFADDATEPGSATLFTPQLYFADNSTKEIDVYARKTGISASAAINPEWQGLISHVRENAGDEGYNTTPAGGLAYVEQKEERAELFSGLLSEDFQEYFVLWIANLTNIPMILTILAVMMLVAYIWKRKFGWILTRQQVSASINALMRTQGRQEYEESRQAAAQHPLSDVDEIGTNAARYWRSEMNAETVDDIVELAAKGIVETDEQGRVVKDDDGNDQYITNGVEDLLDVEPVTARKLREETWLKPILVQDRMQAETVLSNIERALQVAEKQYRRGNQVRKTRMQVQDLLGELKDVNVGEETVAISDPADGRRVPTGGD
jgi:hypothetical protein